MNESITLPDGRQLSWDEFSLLSEAEQNALFKPGKPKEAVPSNDGSDFKITRKELLPRIRAAAESNKLTEEDLLAFIKIMHDIFFPPAPISSTDTDQLAITVKRKYGGAFVQQSKKVMTPIGEFPSLAAAGRAYNTEGARIRAWIKSGKKGFSYIQPEA